MATASEAVLLDLGSVGRPLAAEELFGAPLPLEIELGTGKGRFLIEWASMHPETGLLGVERCRTYVSIAAARIARLGLAHVRLVRTTAEDLLCRCLAPASVAAVHVYFPDPWPKTRHHKRRLLRADALARIAEVLAPGGLLRVKTDHEEYARAIAHTLTAERRLQPVPLETAFAGVPATHYEVKFAREGRPVHRFAAQRV